MSSQNAGKAWIAAFALLTVAQGAARAEEAAVEPPVATVNGEAIGGGELQLMVGTVLGKRKPSRRSDIDDAQLLAREMLIANVAQAQAAVRMGLDKDPGVAGVLAYQRAATLARAYQRALLRQNPVNDERAAAEYARALVKGKAQEFRLAHIVVSQKAQAEAVIAELKRGEKFTDMARIHSLDPNVGNNNGELGWMRIDLLNEYPFVDAVSALKPGEFTPLPVKGATGWHVVKLLEAPRALPSTPKFTELAEADREKIRQRATLRQVDDIEAAALKDATVTRAPNLRVFGVVDSAVISNPGDKP
mgnify:CR=1 FL=1